MTNLPLNLQTFSFTTREKVAGKTLPNQCGRDFFYYVLTYYLPDKYNAEAISPERIRESGLFGARLLSPWLIWTGLTFRKVPKLFSSLGLSFHINGRAVRSYADFILCLLPFNPWSYEKGIAEIEKSVDGGVAVGVDISIALWGLVDHIMFVYAYDEDNLYVFDTHQATGLEYEKTTPDSDQRYIMILPKSVVKKRWTIFNRVWSVGKMGY